MKIMKPRKTKTTVDTLIRSSGRKNHFVLASNEIGGEFNSNEEYDTYDLFVMGTAFENGQDCEQNYGEAVKCYFLSAIYGNIMARNALFDLIEEFLL